MISYWNIRLYRKSTVYWNIVFRYFFSLHSSYHIIRLVYGRYFDTLVDTLIATNESQIDHNIRKWNQSWEYWMKNMVKDTYENSDLLSQSFRSMSKDMTMNISFWFDKDKLVWFSLFVMRIFSWHRSVSVIFDPMSQELRIKRKVVLSEFLLCSIFENETRHRGH